MQLTTQLSLNLELARLAADSCAEKSRTLGLSSCIAVCGPDGHLITFDRTDRAPFQSSQLAQDKAHSVAGNRTPTAEFWELIGNSPWLLNGVQKVTGLQWLGGGVPVVIDGAVVGTVGVSGSGDMAEDIEIAEAGVAIIRTTLEKAL